MVKEIKMLQVKQTRKKRADNNLEVGFTAIE